MTEKEFQNQVVELASLRGWRWYHTHDSRRSNAGFPDLTLVRGDRLLFVELKTERGRLSPEQFAWLEALNETPAEIHIFRPSDWSNLEEILK